MPVGANLLVIHNFRSDEDRPLELVYSFGLPRDVALRRFSVRGEGFRVRSELKPVDEAKQAYEKGIEGSPVHTGSTVLGWLGQSDDWQCSARRKRDGYPSSRDRT